MPVLKHGMAGTSACSTGGRRNLFLRRVLLGRLSHHICQVVLNLHRIGILFDCNSSPDQRVLLRVPQIDRQRSLRISSANDTRAQSASAGWICFGFDASAGAKCVSYVQVRLIDILGQTSRSEVLSNVCLQILLHDLVIQRGVLRPLPTGGLAMISNRAESRNCGAFAIISLVSGSRCHASAISVFSVSACISTWPPG